MHGVEVDGTKSVVRDLAALKKELSNDAPAKGTAPSNLHITGRYILQPEIFELLGQQERGQGGEIQLTDSMITLQALAHQSFHAVRFEGDIYDCGSKIGFLMANIAYAMARADLGPALKAEMKLKGLLG